jgi:hypothetical protein
MTRRPRRRMPVAPLMVALAGPGLETLSGGKRGDPDRCQWICPPPAHGGIQDQPGEQDRRQIGAEQSLGRVGMRVRLSIARPTRRFIRPRTGITNERDRCERNPDVGLGGLEKQPRGRGSLPRSCRRPTRRKTRRSAAGPCARGRRPCHGAARPRPSLATHRPNQGIESDVQDWQPQCHTARARSRANPAPRWRHWTAVFRAIHEHAPLLL